MEFCLEKNVWTRICPTCDQVVEHKTKAKCLGTERLNKSCLRCTQTFNGKNRAKSVKCPICSDKFQIRTEKAKIHAEQHQITIEKLWLLTHPDAVQVFCKCGCGEATNLSNWADGFSDMRKGHNGNIYKIHDKETADEISTKRSNSLKGKPSWCKDKTKENDLRVKKRGKATSKGLKKAHAEGKIKPWNKDKTKENEPRLLAFAKRIVLAYANGTRKQWCKGKTKKDDKRLEDKGRAFSENYKAGKIKPVWHAGKNAKEDKRIADKAANTDYSRFTSRPKFTPEQISEMLKTLVNLSPACDVITKYKNFHFKNLEFECNKCKDVTIRSLVMATSTDRCLKCNPRDSSGQMSLTAFLQNDCSLEVVSNAKIFSHNKQELDCYIPSHHIAIEYNGLYNHNLAAGKDSTYHQNKTNDSQMLNVKLIHIFEDEWLNKQNIVKSLLAQKLNVRSMITRVHARNCQIRELSNKDQIRFFEENHLEGATNAKKQWGLFDGENFVAALSLRIPLHREDKTLEIARFCTKTFYHVNGALSKLIKFATVWAKTNGYQKLVTYVDERLGQGVGYKHSGFIFQGKTTPRFWWTDNHRRFNRFKFKANSKLNLSEAQVAQEAGVVKIYGCSNLIYTLNIS